MILVESKFPNDPDTFSKNVPNTAEKIYFFYYDFVYSKPCVFQIFGYSRTDRTSQYSESFSGDIMQMRV